MDGWTGGMVGESSTKPRSEINSYTVMHDYGRFQYLLMTDKSTVIGEEISVLTSRLHMGNNYIFLYFYAL